MESNLSLTGARFSKDPGTKYDPRKVGCVLASNEADEVHFVSLADDFTEQFLKLLKLPCGMENKKA